jgi:hypothetical protein
MNDNERWDHTCPNCDSTAVQMDGYKWVNDEDCLEYWECEECDAYWTVQDGCIVKRTWKSRWEQD